MQAVQAGAFVFERDAAHQVVFIIGELSGM